jgi:hypothetical protein
MNSSTSRRTFLQKSAAVTFSFPFVKSLEEYALASSEEATAPTQKPATPAPQPQTMPMGKIGNVSISRLICGGN